jgi:hypothetical protein
MTSTVARRGSVAPRSRSAPGRQEARTEPADLTIDQSSGGGAGLFGIRSSSTTVSAWVMMLACSAVVFLVWPATGTGSVLSADIASSAFKYGFGGLQALLVTCMLGEHGVLIVRPFFQLAALALSLIGTLSFAYVQLYRPGETSYGAALFPLIVCAMPAFIPSRVVHVDLELLARSILRLFLLGSIFQIVWQLADVQQVFGPAEISHERTYVLVFLLLLVGFERRLWASASAIFLIALSLYLRPSSTLAGATGIALVAVALRFASFSRLLSCLPYVIIGGLLIQNLVFAADPVVVEAVLKFETNFKQGELDSYSHSEALSNSNFRLAVFRAVNDELNMHSPLFGKLFTGDVNVYIGNYLTWPGFLGFSEIHSDFLAILLQGGIFGYSLFAAIFVGIVRVASRAASLARAAGAVRAEALLSSIPFMTCLFGIYISFNPLMPKVEYVLSFLILAPVTTLCARQLLLDRAADAPAPSGRHLVVSRGEL